jgi:hypothetical protein
MSLNSRRKRSGLLAAPRRTCLWRLLAGPLVPITIMLVVALVVVIVVVVIVVVVIAVPAPVSPLLVLLLRLMRICVWAALEDPVPLARPPAGVRHRHAARRSDTDPGRAGAVDRLAGRPTNQLLSAVSSPGR